jgi:hypothetical protein
VKTCQQGSFRRNAPERFCMIEGGKIGIGACIIDPAFKGNGALPNGWHHFRFRENVSRFILAPQSAQSGKS